MALPKEKNNHITFLNGQIINLTWGEINAIERYARQNGTNPSSIQYDPGSVNFRTVHNLVAKGVFVRSNHLVHFAPGLLPMTGMSHGEPVSVMETLAKMVAEKERQKTKTLAAEKFLPGYRYWPVKPGFEDAWTISQVSISQAEYSVERDGQTVTPLLVTHVRRDGTTRTFEYGEQVAIKGPWKTED